MKTTLATILLGLTLTSSYADYYQIYDADSNGTIQVGQLELLERINVIAKKDPQNSSLAGNFKKSDAAKKLIDHMRCHQDRAIQKPQLRGLIQSVERYINSFRNEAVDDILNPEVSYDLNGNIYGDGIDYGEVLFLRNGDYQEMPRGNNPFPGIRGNIYTDSDDDTLESNNRIDSLVDLECRIEYNLFLYDLSQYSVLRSIDIKTAFEKEIAR